MHASSRPCLVVTGTGRRWVMKLAGAGAGPRGLLTECVAGRIAKAMGTPVPEMRPLHLPFGFPWRVGTDEFDEMFQRSFGWNLGVAFIDGALPATAHDLLAQRTEFLTSLADSDRLLQNVDRTPRNPNLLMSPSGDLRAIDYDACLFLDRAITRRTPFVFGLPPGHLLESVPRPGGGPWSGPIPALPAPVVAETLAGLPHAWIGAAGVSAEELASRLCAYVASAAG